MKTRTRNLDECPFYLISRASLMLISTFKKTFAAAAIDRVRPAFMVVLWVLWERQGLKMIELARAANLEPSTMTGLLDRMEREGFVRREPDPDDRRVMKIFLTDEANAVRESVERLVDETLDLLFTGIPDGEVDAMNGVLRRVISNAREVGSS
jgi:DNA-binding MarR family transcriptional regulator